MTQQVLLLYHFYLNFVLFVHTDHANFDFNRCSIITKCYFQLQKRFEWTKSLFARLPQGVGIL